MTEAASKYPSDRQARAAQLVKEGRIGGPRPGSGRPRKIRASQLAAEAAAEHAEVIVKALLAGVTEGSPEARARSATRWLTAAQREDAHVLHEARDAREADVYDRMTVDEIIHAGTDVVLKLLSSGRVDLDQLKAHAEPVQDAVVVIDES